jgi:hypothetical protein
MCVCYLLSVSVPSSTPTICKIHYFRYAFVSAKMTECRFNVSLDFSSKQYTASKFGLYLMMGWAIGENVTTKYVNCPLLQYSAVVAANGSVLFGIGRHLTGFRKFLLCLPGITLSLHSLTLEVSTCLFPTVHLVTFVCKPITL